MSMRKVKRHKLMPPHGCVICGAEPRFTGGYIPADSSRILWYELCSECCKAADNDPGILDPLEEMLIAAADGEDE